MTPTTQNSEPRIQWQHFAGIFLLSFATLLLELSLIRILSVVNWYHFGFLVISTALLGFGTSGVVLSLWTKLREETPLDHALTVLALTFGFVSLGDFWLMQHIPFQPFRLLLDHWQLVYMLFYYLILAVPFFFSGLAIALLLSRGGPRLNGLYGADLLGAGVGCAAISVVMPAFGGSGTVVIVSVLGVLSALTFRSFRLSKITLLGGVAALIMLALSAVAERAIPIRVAPEKHQHPLLPAGKSPIFTKWNSFSRVEVYEAPTLDENRPDPGFYSIIIDAGAAGTGMHDLSGGVRNYLGHASDYQPAGVSYVGKVHPKVLIIGSGAGREVLEALYFGATSITAVEINPIINDIVTNRMRRHWGGLFEQPEVHLVTEDGRSFVRRSKEKYDAIISVNTYSTAALTSGALTLSESYILTREAFEDYWNHLTSDGTLLITGYSPAKLMATTREMFKQLQLGSPAGHAFAFRGEIAPFGSTRVSPGFLLKKSLLSQDEVNIMAKRVGIGEDENVDEGQHPEVYFSPFYQPRTEYQQSLYALANSQDLERIYAASSDNLRPATDDKPFFNQMSRWKLKLGFRSVFGRSSSEGIGASPIAQVILVVLLIQSIGVAGIMILLPLVRFQRQGLRVSGRWSFLTYFASLGLGFILLEIVFLQRLQLFLGQPSYAFSAVLASLLIFTGLGSYLSGRIEKISYDTLSWFLVAVVAAILLTVAVMPLILSLALGLAFAWRVAITILFIAPLGILLGFPFPTGLRLVGNEAAPLIPWTWAVNGFFTVIGSVVAMILGMVLGFTAVLLIAAVCYAGAWIAIRIAAAHHFNEHVVATGA